MTKFWIRTNYRYAEDDTTLTKCKNWDHLDSISKLDFIQDSILELEELYKEIYLEEYGIEEQQEKTTIVVPNCLEGLIIN